MDFGPENLHLRPVLFLVPFGQDNIHIIEKFSQFIWAVIVVNIHHHTDLIRG